MHSNLPCPLDRTCPYRLLYCSSANLLIHQPTINATVGNRWRWGENPIGLKKLIRCGTRCSGSKEDTVPKGSLCEEPSQRLWWSHWYAAQPDWLHNRFGQRSRYEDASCSNRSQPYETGTQANRTVAGWVQKPGLPKPAREQQQRMQRFEAETVLQGRECDSSKSSPAIEEAAGQGAAPARERRRTESRRGEKGSTGEARQCKQGWAGLGVRRQRESHRTKGRETEGTKDEGGYGIEKGDFIARDRSGEGLAILDREKERAAPNRKPQSASVSPRRTLFYKITRFSLSLDK